MSSTEKIIRIESDGFSVKELKYGTSFDGWIVVTDRQSIKIGISDGQYCCESTGHFITNDDVSDFIGADLLAINIVDECLAVSKAPEVYDGGVMFVNLETSKGTLQFTAYNAHNGYYGHSAVVVSEKFNHSETL